MASEALLYSLLFSLHFEGYFYSDFFYTSLTGAT
jgi:hypothetical protein